MRPPECVCCGRRDPPYDRYVLVGDATLPAGVATGHPRGAEWWCRACRARGRRSLALLAAALLLLRG